jgi:hypothetical protein
MGTAHADTLSESDTSYTGATILEGDLDVTFENVIDVELKEDTYPYAFFEGNTLYLGNSDILDNRHYILETQIFSTTVLMLLLSSFGLSLLSIVQQTFMLL